jgi:site-specific DNA-methyltransferase (adenine-specific)
MIDSRIIKGDCLVELKKLNKEEAQIIICDPPYNIGKDFGNNKYSLKKEEYIHWCSKWINECLRILKPNGTMYIYGLSETLAELMTSSIPSQINKKWLVWHYTNKTVPRLNFWQQSHESILVLWKSERVFNRDQVRVEYTDGYIKFDGKKRAPTIGRFSDGTKETVYKVNPLGALPRDVIKVPSLAGSSKERVSHPTQKPIALCETLIKACSQGKENGYVLVPFAGSGSECVASKKLGLNFIGIELNEEYIEIINKRISITEPSADEPSLNDTFQSHIWNTLSSFKNFDKSKTQYEYYLENNSSSEVLSIVSLNSKAFGSLCEKMICELMGLGKRASSQNDGTFVVNDKTYKFEIKASRYNACSNDCMWQHIEPDYDYDILLCCLLTFTGFDIWYIHKDKIIQLIKDKVIKKQGKQGYIVKKYSIINHLTKIHPGMDLSAICE